MRRKSFISKNNWFKQIELYQKSKSIPLKNKVGFEMPKEGYKFPNTQLTFIREIEKKYGKRRFLCRCDCGNEHIVYMTALYTKSGIPITQRCTKCSYKIQSKSSSETWKRKKAQTS